MDGPQVMKPTSRSNKDARREETARAFEEIKEAERKSRPEKTVRLRSMRLLKPKGD